MLGDQDLAMGHHQNSFNQQMILQQQQQQQAFNNQQFVHSQYNGFGPSVNSCMTYNVPGSSVAISPFAAAIETNFEQSE